MIRYILLLCLLVVMGCHSQEKKHEVNITKESFESVMKANNINPMDYKNIIVIPGSGCTGCISEAETYFKQHAKDKENLFVFTAIGDVKILKMKFKDDNVFGDNVFIDERNELVDNGFDSIYPSSIIINPDQELLEVSVFSK